MSNKEICRAQIFNLSVHEFGYVHLKDFMGGDEDVVDAARISYDRQGTTKDRALIRYLLRHKHTTPFEMVVLKFEVKMPIHVARQWIRHRTASVNEVSARYTQLPEEMFVPVEFSVQSSDNKQGRGEMVDRELQDHLHAAMVDDNENAYQSYQWYLDRGVAKETARGVLNLNIYTKFIWQMNLHNLMHFLHLRLDPHAQKEIRDYAVLIEQMVQRLFPLTHEAFVDYVRDAYNCSRMEVAVLRDIIADFAEIIISDIHAPITKYAESMGMSKREINDFTERFLE